MPKFKVTYSDEIEADTEEEAFKNLLDYLENCVAYQDVEAFNFSIVDPLGEAAKAPGQQRLTS